MYIPAIYMQDWVQFRFTFGSDMYDEDDGEGWYIDNLEVSLYDRDEGYSWKDDAESVDEGSEYTLTLADLIDPGEDIVTQFIVHWGDGGMDIYDGPGDVTHVYPDGPAMHTIVIDLVDEDGIHEAVALLDVVVNNVAPVIPIESTAGIEEARQKGHRRSEAGALTRSLFTGSHPSLDWQYEPGDLR